MTGLLTLDNLYVRTDPATIGAEAVRCLFEALGARVTLDDFDSDVDIVIAPNRPSAEVGQNAWVVVKESGRSRTSMDREILRDATFGFGPVAEMLMGAHAVLVALAGLRRPRRAAVARTAMNEVMATCVADLLIPAAVSELLARASRRRSAPC